jgi:hypothetical protein
VARQWWWTGLERETLSRHLVGDQGFPGGAGEGAGEGIRTLMTSLDGRWYKNPLTRSDVPAGLPGLSARE